MKRIGPYGNRIVDTFPARELSLYEKELCIYDYVEAGIRTGEDVSTLRRKRKHLEKLYSDNSQVEENPKMLVKKILK
ncbi:MAG: hypothetical protein J6K18_03045 [Bacilli bacterium]|nr:hypothetical protein [Bacilli bacterium]